LAVLAFVAPTQVRPIFGSASENWKVKPPQNNLFGQDFGATAALDQESSTCDSVII